VTRAGPFRAQAEARNVKLVRGSWNATYLAELCSFPTGQHDDQVDASSAAFNELALAKRFQIATVQADKIGAGGRW
jgi:predicted phage terminase large subunit-like protein